MSCVRAVWSVLVHSNDVGGLSGRREHQGTRPFSMARPRIAKARVHFPNLRICLPDVPEVIDWMFSRKPSVAGKELNCEAHSRPPRLRPGAPTDIAPWRDFVWATVSGALAPTSREGAPRG